MAKEKKGGVKNAFVQRTPKRRPGRHSKPRGQKTGLAGKHPR